MNYGRFHCRTRRGGSIRATTVPRIDTVTGPPAEQRATIVTQELPTGPRAPKVERATKIPGQREGSLR